MRKYIVDFKYDTTSYFNKFKCFLDRNNIKYEALDDIFMFSIETTPMCAAYIRNFYYIDDVTEDVVFEVDKFPVPEAKIEDENTVIEEYDVNIKSQTDIQPTKKELRFREILGIDEQWKKGRAGNDVRVALVDSGIGEHKYLSIAGRVNFTKSDTARDVLGRGTALGGIIACNYSKQNIKGVAYKCRLLGVKVIEDNSTMNLWSLYQALNWCIKQKIKVIAITVTLPESEVKNDIYLQNLKEIITKANSKGIIVIAPVGTRGLQEVEVPALIKETISVTGVRLRDDDVFTDFSIRLIPNANTDPKNNSIDFSAPGADITTTILEDGFTSELTPSTNMAAAYLAGGVAVLIEAIQKDNKIYKTNYPVTPEYIYASLMRDRIDTTAFSWMPQEEGGKGLATYFNHGWDMIG